MRAARTLTLEASKKLQVCNFLDPPDTLISLLSSNVYPHSITKYYNPACIVYECLTWSLALREELRLRVFQERLLNRFLDLRRSDRGLNRVT
jgi:hypothetical protein